jgi:hypothetical protein
MSLRSPTKFIPGHQETQRVKTPNDPKLSAGSGDSFIAA